MLAKIRVKGKLSFDEVQAYFDGTSDDLANQLFTPVLDQFREVGGVLLQRAADADGVEYLRREVKYSVSEDGTHCAIDERDRSRVERMNEQISLMDNGQGAEFLSRHLAKEGGAAIHPIFKVHDAPVEARLLEFSSLLDGLIEVRKLDPDIWAWRPGRGRSLGEYLGQLPTDGPDLKLTRAVHCQAAMVNRAAKFSIEPGPHHGIGADLYTRLTAPMREMVGIYLQRQVIEAAFGAPPDGWGPSNQLEQADMLEVANRSSALQKKVAKEADRAVLDYHLSADLDRDLSERPIYRATIVGLSRKKIYVHFEEPPLDLKLYIPDLERGGAEYSLDESRAFSKSSNPAALPDLVFGDTLSVRVTGFDRKHYQFEIVT